MINSKEISEFKNYFKENFFENADLSVPNIKTELPLTTRKLVYHALNYKLFDFVQGRVMIDNHNKNYQLEKNIIELLAVRLMNGNNCGKKILTYTIIKNVLELFRTKDKLNPLVVLFSFLEKGLCLHNVRYLKYGSGNLSRAVFNSFKKSISLLLKNLVKEALKTKKKKIHLALYSLIKETIEETNTSKIINIKKEQEKIYYRANIANV